MSQTYIVKHTVSNGQATVNEIAGFGQCFISNHLYCPAPIQVRTTGKTGARTYRECFHLYIYNIYLQGTGAGIVASFRLERELSTELHFSLLYLNCR